MVGRSECHVKHLYTFVEFLNTIKVNEIESMVVLFDVVSLLTNISIDLAIEIARKQMESYPSEDLQEITNWSVEEICTGLKICLQATYLKFCNKFFP